eukprot:g18153.t1
MQLDGYANIWADGLNQADFPDSCVTFGQLVDRSSSYTSSSSTSAGVDSRGGPPPPKFPQHLLQNKGGRCATAPFPGPGRHGSGCLGSSPALVAARSFFDEDLQHAWTSAPFQHGYEYFMDTDLVGELLNEPFTPSTTIK